jgi:choice-of-anchor A domain-containing protein
MSLHSLTSWLQDLLEDSPTGMTLILLNRRRFKVEHLETRATPSTFDLGAANPFNGFFLGNFSSSYSDTEGRLAVAGNATMTGYGLGDKLPNSNGTRDDLIVGGNLKFTNGQVFYGNVAVAGKVKTDSFGLPNGTIKHSIGIDFNAADADLEARSAAWAAMTDTGTVKNEFGTLKLTGTDPVLNVFSLTAHQLAKCNGLSITVPNGAEVLINVSGHTVTMSNFAIWLNGTTKDKVLFNMPETMTLKMSSIGVPASILAPCANVTFNNGQLNGTLVAWTFKGNGQLNYVPPPQTDVQPASLFGKVCAMAADGTPIFINNVTLLLTGTDDTGPVSRVLQTDVTGHFLIDGLRPGTYTLTVIESPGFEFASAVPGSLGGTPSGMSITNIVVHSGDHGVDYGFMFGNYGSMP